MRNQAVHLRLQIKIAVLQVVVFVLAINEVAAQAITVAPASSNAEVTDYVENVLLGSCVTASNITFVGADAAAGTFDATGTILGIDNGVVLTSGQALMAVGPDNANSLGFGNANSGDPDLTTLAAGFQTYDAVILEFDFVPLSDTLRFNYIFGSEEYSEYVNSGYNDVFGFFISGPGFSGPFTGGAENIALIPGTNIPVAIDNVNNGYSAVEPATAGPCTNCAYFVDNASGPAVQYDAHTTVLTAKAAVTPCESYHIKIAIADAGDGALDSGVFLEAGSFSASGNEPVELEAVANLSGVYEGCDIGSFIFRRLAGSNNTNPVTVGYNVSGSATSGVDYTALPGSITIPAGEDSVVLNIEGILDFTAEGNETVTLELVGGGCSCTAPPQVSIDILDNDIQLSLSTSGSDTICLGESATLTANVAGSIAPYTSGWDNGAPSGNSASVSPTQTTTYTFTISDACGGQSLTSTETIVVVNSSFTVDDDEQCLNGNSFSFTNTGQSDPSVTHDWDFGDGNSSNQENPTHSYASAGDYTVSHQIINPAAGCTASADALIRVFDGPVITANVDQDVSCSGGSDGAISTSASGGQGPFNYSWLPNGETTSSISGLTTGNYTVTVTDANGCTDAVTATVTQNDSEPPIALCQDASVQLNPMGIATLSATLVDNGSSDNCGIASLVVSPNAFSCAEVGPNNVTLTVTDVNGNVATCDAIVTVQDTVPPLAVCQDVNVVLDGSGNASVDATQVENGSSDNCAIQSIMLSPNSFSCADIGSNQVTLTVTDTGGNIGTCDATVTVSETADPTAVCQDITVQLDAAGSVSITGNDVGSVSTDNCVIADISVGPTDFTCSDIGANTVTVTVTDASGNADACNATVTVEDNLQPTAVCADVTIYLDAVGSASVSAADVDGGSSDNCGIATITVDPSDFTCAELGPNTVNLTVTDINGNSSSCSSTVAVADTIDPSAVCQDITLQLDASGMASVTAAQIDNGSIDNCGSVTISIDPTTFDCTVASPAQVELTVTDDSGNSSTCTATVTLEENTPPTAVCQDVTVQLDANGNASIVAADVDGGSFDNCGVVDLSVDPSTFDCSNVGPNVVTLTVTDASGNSSTCTATVTVEDLVPPVANCQDVIIQLDATGSFTLVESDVDAGSNDNCSVSTISVSPSSFDCSNLGTETVTLTVTDAFGNGSTCSAQVTVLDTVPPLALCQDIIVQLDNNGNASIVAGQIDAGSTDVCGIASVGLDITSFSCIDVGINTVELTVTDNSGNTSTCTAEVTVEDNVPPVAICQNLTVYLDSNGMVIADPNDADGGSTDNCGIASSSLSPADFLCENLGQEIVTLTVDDSSGNTDDCVAVITVLDTISPVVIGCPIDTIITAAANNCAPNVSWAEPTTTDNCTPIVSSNYNSGDSFPVGTTTVVYTVADSSGNEVSCAFDVTVQSAPLTVSFSSPTYPCGTNISCAGLSDGESTVVVSGGCEPYNFTWSDGQTTQTAIGLGAGEHILIVEDGNGSTVSDTILLTEPDILTTDNLSSPKYEGDVNVSCSGFFDASINLSVLGGAVCQPYTYSWSGPNGFSSTNEDLTDLEAGNYVVSIADAHGCTHIDSIELIEPEPLVAQAFPNSYNGFNVTCFGADDGFINLEVTGGIESYAYTWSNGDTIQDIDSLVAGTYNVLVTDTNGCQTSLSIDLVEPPALQITVIDTIPVACAGELNGQFEVQVSGGVPTYSYLWSNGDIDPILNGVGVGVYQVIVTDQNGCQDSLELEMQEPTQLEASVVQITNTTCFDGDDGSATVSASGGIGPYDYNWLPSGESSATANGLSAGEQIYTITDANGCSFSDTLEVGQPNQVVIVTSNDTTVCPGTVVPLSAAVSGGGGTYLITWENGDGFGETYTPYITQTTNVSVTAVDQNGCEAVPNSVIVNTFAPVNAEFGYTVTDPCVAPFQVDFSNTSTNANAYSWTFANGDQSNQFLPSTVFDSSGVYSVSLVATSEDGCVDTLNSFITIDNLPQANFGIPNPDGCFPIMAGHFNQSTGADSYFWNFGDGNTSEDGSPYHFYEEPGAYTVTLIATNQNGCADTLSVDSAVFAFPRPEAAFTPTQDLSGSGDEYYFDNTAQGATEYFWNFGNGDFSELFEPTYEYPEHGSYDIILTATNAYGCSDTALFSINVDLTSGLFVPNAMAVGEFGEAGLFLPKGEGLGQYHVWVFDLWGNLLWESTALNGGSPAEGWDGRYNGELVPQGAYTWKISALFKDGEVWEGMEQTNGKRSNVGSITVLY